MLAQCMCLPEQSIDMIEYEVSGASACAANSIQRTDSVLKVQQKP